MTLNLSTTCANGQSPSADEQNRLASILDEYLRGLESGQPLAPEDLLARHPGDADRLRGYLSGLALFHQAAQGSPSPPPDAGTGRASKLCGELGDFRLLREIGRGGMGTVFEAVQISLDRRVAVKVLPFSASIDEKQLARFKNEAHAAAQVDHPNIVPVFAIGQEHGIHFFAMQYIGGQSLSQLLAERRSSVPTGVETAESIRSSVHASQTLAHVRSVARMGLQAAQAIHAAHEFGVVHRDIKPSNLLLDEKGKVWVTDFGVARCKRGTRITETGDALGTMRYMSPEQAAGDAALVDHRTDVYSLGVTLYELATLRHPFEDVPDAAMAFEFGRTGLRRPRYWNQAIPADFENIVLKAMSEGRDERYTTARDLADDLERFLEGKPTLARRPSLTSRVSKWARRHRRSVAAAITVLVMAVAGVVASLAMIASERAVAIKAHREATTAHQEALAHEQRAEARFDQAWEMLNRLGTLAAERLANVPGAEGVRKELLALALPYYQDFARDSADDPDMLAHLALTYSKIGYLSDQLGALDDAEAAYKNALAVLQRLVDTEPSESEHARRLALCYNNFGQLLQKRGEMDDARRRLGRALEIQERLVDRSRESISYRADLATTESNLGLLASRMGDDSEAAQRHWSAIQIQDSIRQSAPEDASNLKNLAASYNNLSSLYVHDRPEFARELVERALSLQYHLVELDQLNRDYQSDLALSFNNLGAILSRQSQWAEAEAHFGDAIKIQTLLHETAPGVTAYGRDLAVSYNNLGMAQKSAGRLDAAAETFAQALEIQRELVHRHRQDLSLLSSLGGIFNNLGMVHQTAGRLAEACIAFEEAINYQRQALERAPHVGHFRETLSKHLYNYAQVLRSMDRPDAALDATLARRELWRANAGRLLRVAEELAATCKEIAPSAIRERYLHETKSTLEAAMDAGLESPPDQSEEPFDVLTDAPRAGHLEVSRS